MFDSSLEQEEAEERPRRVVDGSLAVGRHAEEAMPSPMTTAPAPTRTSAAPRPVPVPIRRPNEPASEPDGCIAGSAR